MAQRAQRIRADHPALTYHQALRRAGILYQTELAQMQNRIRAKHPGLSNRELRDFTRTAMETMRQPKETRTDAEKNYLYPLMDWIGEDEFYEDGQLVEAGLAA